MPPGCTDIGMYINMYQCLYIYIYREREINVYKYIYIRYAARLYWYMYVYQYVSVQPGGAVRAGQRGDAVSLIHIDIQTYSTTWRCGTSRARGWRRCMCMRSFFVCQCCRVLVRPACPLVSKHGWRARGWGRMGARQSSSSDRRRASNTLSPCMPSATYTSRCVCVYCR